MHEPAKKRPEFRNINLFSDVAGYRLPLAALVSILHRVSGLLMLLLLPFILWLFDKSVSSEISFGTFRSAFDAGIGWFPAWLLKLVVLALIWSYLHHLFAGVRHLWMDMTHNTEKAFGRQTALATLVAAVVLTLVLGAKLFGLY